MLNVWSFIPGRDNIFIFVSSLLSQHQNAGQNYYIKIKFRYLGKTIISEILIKEEIKRKLNSGNVCYHLIQDLLSSRLLSKIIKMRIYKTIILPVVLYGCETWSLTLREERRLRVFENRMLRRIFGQRGMKRQEIEKTAY
jgi:hypothetical protein